jgi:omega-6 fatty acid desaturase (delta-12 desaturase)
MGRRCISAAAAGIWALLRAASSSRIRTGQDSKTWDYAAAAIRGSSYLKLPGVLRWFTAHRPASRPPPRPAYSELRLQRCHDENDVFHDVTIITLTQSVRTLRLTLWDEARGRLVGFREIGV